MHKKQFLNDDFVCQFSDWLSLRLDSDELPHNWIDRRSKEKHFFANLFDAYSKFNWSFQCTLPDGQRVKGKSSKSNEKILCILSTLIRKALADNDDELALKSCISILEWGGVTANNRKWIQNQTPQLINYLKTLKKIILSERTEHPFFIERFNSGMSKICSLMLDDFIIFDSRVAAALGMLIVKFCRASNLSTLPKNLKFPRMIAKESPGTENPKNRNPSTEDYVFPLVQHGSAYLNANIRASWLLEATLKKASLSNFHVLKDPLNALGSALFMYGYDLGGRGITTKQATQKQKVPKRFRKKWSSDQLEKDDFSFETRGVKRKKFCAEYYSKSKTIIFRNKEGRTDHFPIEEIYQIIMNIHNRFDFEWFPLANNVQKLGTGTEKEGLGTAILKQRPTDITYAQASSYLGPFLDELGLFKWNQKRKGICWQIVSIPRTVKELEEIVNTAAKGIRIRPRCR